MEKNEVILTSLNNIFSIGCSKVELYSKLGIDVLFGEDLAATASWISLRQSASRNKVGALFLFLSRQKCHIWWFQFLLYVNWWKCSNSVYSRRPLTVRQTKSVAKHLANAPLDPEAWVHSMMSLKPQPMTWHPSSPTLRQIIVQININTQARLKVI